MEDKILLATVAVKKVDDVMKAQMQSRLKHLGFQLGLLANSEEVVKQKFGDPPGGRAISTLLGVTQLGIETFREADFKPDNGHRLTKQSLF